MQAEESGERVEVIDKRTETAQTFANPDGTFTLEQSNMPVRMERDGQWIDLDPTLAESSDGRVRPKASSLDMSFSGGGTDALITMKSDGHEMKLGWPDPLPEPVVEGDSITYPSVFPDVDLKITASTNSYSEVLVVKTPEAARLPQLQQLDLDLEAPGLDVAKVAGGAILAKDELGKVIFTGPPPVMWDSRGDAEAPTDADRTEAPLEGDKVVPIPVEVGQDSMTISPAGSLVNDAAAEYPLHIDPPFNNAKSDRTMINEHYPTTASWAWAGPEGVGYQSFEPWSRKRLIYRMGIPGLAGTHITSAVFSAYSTWSASCTKKEVQVWKAGAISTGTTWSNGAGSNVWLKKVASVVDAVGRDGCTPNGKWFEFNVVTAVAEQAAARSGVIQLGLRAASETDTMAWKRFRSDVKLAVTYNNRPVLAGARTTEPTMGCATNYAAPYRINQDSPIPRVKIIDKDRQPSRVDFQFWYNGSKTPDWTGSSATMASSSTLEYTPTTDVRTFTAGRLVGWKARGWDGVDYTAWSSMCWFILDKTKPPSPKITVDGEGPYPLGQPITVHLTVTTNDPNYFKYTVDTEEPTSPPLAIVPGTFTYLPEHPGPLKIKAWSFDRAGNRSETPSEQVVNIAVGPTTGHWEMDEGSGTSLADNSGQGHPVNLGPTAVWAQGDRWNPDATGLNDWSVLLQNGAIAATAASNVVDTSRSFSVSARVRLAAKPGRQVVVSEDRTGAGGFTLGALSQDLTDPDDLKAVWSFSLPDPDGSGEIAASSLPMPYSVGDWVYLTGVYNSAERQMALFVDGVQMTFLVDGAEVKTIEVPGTARVADGTGPLRLGLSHNAGVPTSLMDGQIDDVRIYPGPIDDTIVDVDMADSDPNG